MTPARAPITFTPSEIRAYCSHRVPGLRESSDRAWWTAPCPVHQGKDPNFHVNMETGAWHCHSQCGRGGDLIGLEMELSGAPFLEAKRRVYELVGSVPPPVQKVQAIYSKRRRPPWLKPTEYYPYLNLDGELKYQTIRFEGINPEKNEKEKDFSTRQPGPAGDWIPKEPPDAEKILYRWPDWHGSENVLLAEGERKADDLWKLGLPATAALGGSGRAWLPQYTAALQGKRIAIFPDNDSHGAGQKWALRVAKALHAAGIYVKLLPVVPFEADNPHGQDISDWIAAGATRDEVVDFAQAAPPYQPPAEEPLLRDADTLAHGSRAEAVPDLVHFQHNDHGNSERLIAMQGADIRYCPPIRKWLIWDGRRWAVDAAEQSRRMAKETMLEFLRQSIRAGEKAGEKFAMQSLDSKRITNCLREAQDRLYIMPSDLDKNPFLLNFTNGTVELQTGTLMPHSREDFITKMIHHRFNSEAMCPRFLQFLDEVTGVTPDSAEADVARSEKIVTYLQRAFGYSLTGVTSEKAVFLLHGPRDNGKSTLLATFLQLLEEYAVLLQIDTLMSRSGGESNNTQADLADLRGARFVMTSETEEGQRLAEGKLKRITQGVGRIKATRKYENPVEFPETHKLWIDANHLPVIRSHDEATWRRLHAIPFHTIIPREKQDRTLAAKLLSEAEGILAWAVQGAVAWWSDKAGLQKPDAVEQTNAAWRDSMNQVGRFVEECCVVGEMFRAKARILFQAYQKWSEAAGERSMSVTPFTERLQEMGYERKHTKVGNEYIGIGLAAEREEAR